MIGCRAGAECAHPGGPLPATPVTAWVVAQKLATWPETGQGILYSQATGAHVCFSPAQSFYLAVNANHIAGARAVNLGDVVLKPGLDFFYPSRERLRRWSSGWRTELEAGGYTPSGTGPVLGPAQLTVLSALGAAGLAVPVVIWRRRATADPTDRT